MVKKPLLSVFALVLLALAAPALDLGDKAPAITPDVWITGEPADPTVVDDKTFYIVEVWSVTCPPCVDSIPLLNAVQKRYADQGLKIVSFTSDSAEDVKEFLSEHPMEYSSFIDKEGGSFVNYMAADNRNTIPHAFLFDRSGSLVWIGNPLDNIEAKVKKVIDGSLNLEYAVKLRDGRAALQTAFQSQDVDGMLSSLKALEEIEPENGQYYQIHYRILTELGAGDDNDVKQVLNAWFKGGRDSAESMMILSVVAIDQGAPNHRNPALALAAAKRAYALAPEMVESGLTLAETYKELGRLDLAIGVVEEMAKNAAPEQTELMDSLRRLYERMREVGQNPDAEYKPE